MLSPTEQPPSASQSETSNSTSISPAAATPLASTLQPLSCTRCAHRKIKCNRLKPCAACFKHNVPCQFPPPKTEKRRRRKALTSASAAKVDLQSKLTRYEQLLQGFGVDTDKIHDSRVPVLPTSDESAPTTVEEDLQIGHLVISGKKTRFVEGALWIKLDDESENPAALLPQSSDDESVDESDDEPDGEGYRHRNLENEVGGLPLGISQPPAILVGLFPSPGHFDILWKVFVENVHPLTMFIHAPSAKDLLFSASGGQSCAPRDVEALLFAVIAIALVSLTDAECQQKLGLKKCNLLARYHTGAEITLINSKYLVSSSLTVLQAFILYLLSIRADVDPRAFWNLTGIARRNAQRLGLHQQSTGDLSPFEVEMRRRLWYYIVQLDVAASIPAGTHSRHDVPEQLHSAPPLNVNDSDLSPDMQEAPTSRIGATDMVFIQLWFKISQFLMKANTGKFGWDMTPGRWHHKVDPRQQAERRKSIDQLEKELELGLLRYCDFLTPVHHLTATMARFMLCKLRFSVLHPLQYDVGLQQLSSEEKDLLFKTALKVIEYDNNINQQSLLQGFLWHKPKYFQFSCAVHVLDEVKIHPESDETGRVWELLQGAYESRPDMFSKKLKLAMYVTVNRLTLEAWQARRKEAERRGHSLKTPAFIEKLRLQSEPAACRNSAPDSAMTATRASSATPQSLESSDSRQVGGLDPVERVNFSEWPEFSTNQSDDLQAIDWTMLDAMMDNQQFPSFGMEPDASVYRWQ